MGLGTWQTAVGRHVRVVREAAQRRLDVRNVRARLRAVMAQARLHAVDAHEERLDALH